MSKQALQQAAYELSGVTYEESLVATSAASSSSSTQAIKCSMYDRMGGNDGCLELSKLFYDRVFADKTEGAWFLNIFSSSTKQEAIDNQYRYFVQTFGGPDLYRQKKGKYTRLVGRHANYNIGKRAAERWVEHMAGAIHEHSVLVGDEGARLALLAYFRYTAFYIVVASEYMRPDQLSGGTKMDADKVW